MAKFEYTQEELVNIVQEYKQGTTLEVLAERYSKSVASIRMKLVKQGVYQKQTKTSAGTKTKSEVVDQYETSFKLVGAALV